MSKLLKMGRVGRSLDVVKKQLNAPDVDELDKVLKGHIQLTGDIESRRVIAEEESHYVLIRGTHNIEKARRERRKKSTEDADVDEKEIIEIESDDEDIVDALRRKLKQQKENQLQGKSDESVQIPQYAAKFNSELNVIIYHDFLL